jgi:hypothetical protein
MPLESTWRPLIDLSLHELTHRSGIFVWHRLRFERAELVLMICVASLTARGIEVGLGRPNFVPIAKDGEHEPPAKWPNPNEVFPTCQDKLTN